MTKLEKLLSILEDHQANCGENRGRDGEYLDQAMGQAVNIVLKLVQDEAASAVVDKVLAERKA